MKYYCLCCLLLVSFVFSMSTIEVYATSADDYGYYTIGGECDINCEDYGACRNAILSLVSTFKYDDCSHMYFKYGDYLKIWHYSSKAILVQREDDSSYYDLYMYNSSTDSLVSINTFGDSTVKDNYCANYLSSQPYVQLKKDVVDFYGFVDTPVANSKANALLYAQTGDLSYLENPEDFVDVPMVNNFSIYQASEENNAYFYYENSQGFSDLSVDVIDDGSKQTVIEYKYFYYDAAGDAVDITEYETVTLDYYRRNQYPISCEPISNYDTGYINARIYNEWNPGGKSNIIELNYDVNTGSYGYFIIGKDGNKIGIGIESDAVIKKDVLDFGSKNDSYTGADVSDEVDNSFLSGDFSFLGFIFSGFGLIGENGLVALMGKIFSFLPNEFIILIGSGIAAVIILCFVKILMK